MSSRDSQPTQRSSVTAIVAPAGSSSSSYSGSPRFAIVSPNVPSSTLTNAFCGYVPIGCSIHVAGSHSGSLIARCTMPKCWSAFDTEARTPDGKCTRRRWSSAALKTTARTSARGTPSVSVTVDTMRSLVDALLRDARSAARPDGSSYVISTTSERAPAAVSMRMRGGDAGRSTIVSVSGAQ